MESQKLLDWG